MTIHSLLCTRVRLKVLSLLFAAVLWLFAVLESAGQQEFSVELKPVNYASGLVVIINPPQVKVRLGGARTLLLRQKLIGLSAEIDLHQSGTGAISLENIEPYLDVVPGLKVLAVMPESSDIIITKKK